MTKALLISVIFLLAPLSIFGQSLGGINGDCMLGGEQALTSGLPSTATQQIGTTNVNAGAGVQASFPGCIVTVYATGTINKANIFSDNNPTPTPLVNPFVANVDGSFTFFVKQGACYDITMSSGSIPQPYPRTLTDVCVGTGGGGGGGAIGPGTVPHIPVWITATNIGDSEGISTGTSAVQWPLGVNIVTGPLEREILNSTSPGTVQYLLVALDSSGNARLAQPTDGNNLVGIADIGAGTTGLVWVAYSGQFKCLADNQTGINDFGVLGAGSQCHDVGAAPAAGVQNIVRFDSVNAGAGTLATVHIGPDIIGANSNNGTVSQCNTVGGIAYYNAIGTTVVCDPLFTTDGAGNFQAISGTFNGPTAGFVAFGQSSKPSFSQANSFYFYAPTSITTSVGEDVVAGSKRVCMMIFGADNASGALANTDIGPQLKQCQIPYSATVYEIDVASDAGTPSVIVGKRHCTVSPCVTGANETVSNLVSGALAAGTSGATACSKTGATAGLDTFTTCSATLQNTTIAIGDWIETVSATAGGTAKRMSVAVHFVVN